MYGYVVEVGNRSQQEDYFKTFAGAKRAAKKFIQDKISQGIVPSVDASVIVYDEDKIRNVKFYNEIHDQNLAEIDSAGTAEEILRQLGQ